MRLKPLPSENYCIVRDSAQLKIYILVSTQLTFVSCIVEAIEVVPNNKVSFNIKEYSEASK